jgi:hypothetical protein
MGLIRPEVWAQVSRWREALIGIGVGILGLFWALTGLGVLSVIGWGLCLLAPVLVVAGLLRGRFRTGDGGPGVVSVSEGQVSYFGPLDGGAVALSEVSRLSLDTQSHPSHWVIEQPGQPPLHVPLTANGADALFDSFVALPGFRTDQMLAEMHRKTAPRTVVIWEKSGQSMRLH